MAFTWFDKFTDVLDALPDDCVSEMALAIVHYGADGIEPEFSNPLLGAVFAGIRGDIDMSKKARTKNKGGRPKKREAAPEAESAVSDPPVSETENPRENLENGGFETQKPPFRENGNIENPSYKNNIGQYKIEQSINPPNPSEGDSGEFEAEGFADEAESVPGDGEDPEADGERFAAFAAACFDVFNAETGKDCRIVAEKDFLPLRRIYDSGRTLDDVRRVVRSKAAQWGSDPQQCRFLRPSTLFGPKFEEYLNEGPVAARGQDLGECPDCGHSLQPIGAAVENPKDPTKLWCPKCRKALAREAARCS